MLIHDYLFFITASVSIREHQVFFYKKIYEAVASQECHGNFSI
jgi:hypothetical protein